MTMFEGNRQRLTVLLGLGLVLAFGAGSARAAEYVDGWGPAVGSQLPVLEAPDQTGTIRTLDDLTGPQGLLLFLSRSADW